MSVDGANLSLLCWCTCTCVYFLFVGIYAYMGCLLAVQICRFSVCISLPLFVCLCFALFVRLTLPLCASLCVCSPSLCEFVSGFSFHSLLPNFISE
jgi:hypothetical protein